MIIYNVSVYKRNILQVVQNMVHLIKSYKVKNWYVSNIVRLPTIDVTGDLRDKNLCFFDSQITAIDNYTHEKVEKVGRNFRFIV